MFVTGTTRRIHPRQHAKLMDLLDILDAATHPRDLSGVSGFHALRGDRRGTYAMIVTRNWRLTFGFENAEAFDVDFEDYH